VTRYGAADWDRVVEVLGAADEVTIASHVKPDGDALGSLLGASLALRKLGKKTRATWDASPAALPVPFEWLPGAASVVQPEEVRGAETFLALDCGAGDRLGSLQEAARAGECLINIDHHPGNDDFGDLNVVVTTASSTAELVARLLEDMNVPLDTEIATCLYVGMVTDTGRFQYSNTRPDTLRLAAELLSYDVPAPLIAQKVFESSSFGLLKLTGRVLDRAVLVKDARLVYSWMSRADLDDTGVSITETDSLIDAVRSTSAADVAAIFKEQPDGRFRVSLRSKGPGVGAIARSWGGGGHDLAAGFTAVDIDSTVESVARALASGG